MAHMVLEINGETRTIDVDPTMPLLWVLRDVLNLTGTKYGCGIGACGACTVHLDGTAIRSCQMRAKDIADKKITTIEGLAKAELNPLQAAWIEEQVPQCGYCQPGQIMSAMAFLASHPNPTEREMNEAMAGNICRCATYFRIRKAIRRAAETARR